MTTAHRTAAGLVLLAAPLVLAPHPLDAQNVHRAEDHAFVVDTVVDGLDHPWGLAFLPEGDPAGDILITERPGQLRIVHLGPQHGSASDDDTPGDAGSAAAPAAPRLDPTPVSGVPEVWSRGQGGLLDVALHPEFASNRWVYLSYSKPGGAGATTAVIRGRLEGHALLDVEEILEADAWRRGGRHFGSRLVFHDGYLYVTIGERGQMQAAQDRSNHQGNVLRLNDDGSVPEDNPFVGQDGVRPEVWTWGTRNPQGLDVHPIDYDGSIISEDTARAGMEQPLIYWDPSIATSGLEIYDGDAFPAWQGDAFVGGLRGLVLARVDLVDDGARADGWERLLPGYARIRQVRQGPDGYLWLLLDQEPAPLVRLVPAD